MISTMKKNTMKPGGVPRNLLSPFGGIRSDNTFPVVMPSLSFESEFKAASQHHSAGRLGEAERICRNILAHMPRHADALHVCGVVAAQTGRLAEAAELIGRAIDANPTQPLYYRNLANALKDGGHSEKAMETLRKCLRYHARDAEAHFLLGTLFVATSKSDEAIGSFREAVRHRPGYAEAWNKLGMALAGKDQLDEAMTAFRHSLNLAPAAPTWNNLANALTRKGDMEQAIEAYRTSLRMAPDLAETWCNLGINLQEIGAVDEAIAALEQAIRLKPRRGYAHWNISQSLLLKGELLRGWAEYEWRWKLSDFKTPRPDFSQPQWHGEDLNGRTILMYLEQGRGDVIQFIRYASRCWSAAAHKSSSIARRNSPA